MRISKSLLATTSALTLTMSTAAFAGGNEAYLDQQGDYNSALILQDYGSNSNNIAGNTGTESILQDGDANELYVSQQGSQNRVGSDIFFQRSDSNLGPSDLANQATITQFSDFNTVEKIRQNAVGASLAAGPNEVAVEQGASSGTGNLNYIRDIAQEGADNYLLIKQTGEVNYTHSARQEGSDNEASLLITGDHNGQTPYLTFNSDYAGAGGNTVLISTGAVGAFGPSSVEQRGTGNRTDLTITGDSNQYGIQNGRYKNTSQDNLAERLLITGDFNELGINQVGSRNVVSLSTIAGDYNSVGIVQTVDDNEAKVNIAGSFNEARVIENGSNNDVDHWVERDYHTATIDILGDGNQLNTQQRWGNGNQMSVSVTGNSNNASGALSGNAGIAFAAANGVTGLPMSAGSLWQHKSNNQMTMTVTGDDNLFAALQRGKGNALTGTVIGSNNQAAVAQNGNNNTANFVQNGSYNNLGIIQ